jgi:hypothetical protein
MTETYERLVADRHTGLYTLTVALLPDLYEGRHPALYGRPRTPCHGAAAGQPRNRARTPYIPLIRTIRS